MPIITNTAKGNTLCLVPRRRGFYFSAYFHGTYCNNTYNNHYKGLFVVMIDKQVPVAQWVGVVAHNAGVGVRYAVKAYFFYFFSPKTIFGRFRATFPTILS